MAKLIGDEGVHAEALAQMRENRSGGEWYAYQNQDLGHPQLGHLRFLKVGENCTYKVPPKRYPDIQGANGCIGWRYGLVGKVDLGTGKIEDMPIVPQTESVENARKV